MPMKQIKRLLAASILAVLMIACGGSDAATASSTKTGTLALKLIDAPGDFEAVYVTIKEVRVHLNDDESNTTDQDANKTVAEDNDVAEDQNDTDDETGWKTVVSPNKTYDLLELQNGVEAVLGEENLTVGHYTQMRLVLATKPDDSNNTQDEAHPFANYVMINGNAFELTTPSAKQSGIKLIKGFDIDENTTTTLTLDFDAEKSVHSAGSKWMLKPTITITQE